MAAPSTSTTSRPPSASVSSPPRSSSSRTSPTRPSRWTASPPLPGSPKGTLYLYFPSKDALYLGVLSDGLDGAYRAYQSDRRPQTAGGRAGAPFDRGDGRVLRSAARFPAVLRDRRAAAVRGAQSHHRRLARARLQFLRLADRRGNPPGRLHARRSAPRDHHDPGRDSLAAVVLRPEPPGRRTEPRARQHDASIARRGSGAAPRPVHPQ